MSEEKINISCFFKKFFEHIVIQFFMENKEVADLWNVEF